MKLLFHWRKNIVTSVSVKTTWQEIWSVFVSFTQSAPDWLGGIQDQSPRCNTALYIGIHKCKHSYSSKRIQIYTNTIYSVKNKIADGEGGEMGEMHRIELTPDLSRAPEQATQASPLSNICPILVINIILIIIATIIMIRIRARRRSNHVSWCHLALLH